MDPHSDPDLAKEMFKLLGQELKALKAQLKQAQDRESSASGSRGSQAMMTADVLEENRRLKDEIESLRCAMAASQSIQVKSEELGGSSNPMVAIANLQATVDDLSSQLADGLVKQRELSHANESLQTKLTKLRDKYSNIKTTDRQLRVASESLIERLETAEGECSVVKDKLSEELKRHEQRFNPLAWLRQPPITPDSEQSRPHHFPLPMPSLKNLDEICGRNGHFWLEHMCILQPTERSNQRLLVCQPASRFNPVRNPERWEAFPIKWNLGDEKEVFDRTQNNWVYLGRYKCEYAGSVNIGQLKPLMSNADLRMIQTQTILSTQFVPPILTNMVAAMHAANLLEVWCVALRYVQHQQKVFGALLPNTANRGNKKRHASNADLGGVHPSKHLKGQKHENAKSQWVDRGPRPEHGPQSKYRCTRQA